MQIYVNNQKGRRQLHFRRKWAILEERKRENKEATLSV